MSVPASVMCTLCGEAGKVETDIFNPASVADALWWAVHFATAHPEVPNGVSRYLVMTPGSANPAREWCASCPACHPGKEIAESCGEEHDCAECAEQRGQDDADG